MTDWSQQEARHIISLPYLQPNRTQVTAKNELPGSIHTVRKQNGSKAPFMKHLNQMRKSYKHEIALEWPPLPRERDTLSLDGFGPIWGLVHQHTPPLMIKVVWSFTVSGPEIVHWRQAMTITISVRESFSKHWPIFVFLIRISITHGRQLLRTWWVDRSAKIGLLWSGICSITVEFLCIKKTASTTSCPSHSMLVSRFMKIWLEGESTQVENLNYNTLNMCKEDKW